MARLRLLRGAALDGVAADRRFEAQAGPLDSVLVAFGKAGVPLRHDCGGKALCGTCRVQLSDPPARGLSPVAERERLRLAAVGAPLDGTVRLSCQLRSLVDLELSALVPLDRAGKEEP